MSAPNVISRLNEEIVVLHAYVANKDRSTKIKYQVAKVTDLLNTCKTTTEPDILITSTAESAIQKAELYLVNKYTTKSKTSKGTSKSSSIKRQLLEARLLREELERQAEAEEKLESHRRKIAEAKITEALLQDDLSQQDSTSDIDAETTSQRTEQWVNTVFDHRNSESASLPPTELQPVVETSLRIPTKIATITAATSSHPSARAPPPVVSSSLQLLSNTSNSLYNTPPRLINIPFAPSTNTVSSLQPKAAVTSAIQYHTPAHFPPTVSEEPQQITSFTVPQMPPYPSLPFVSNNILHPTTTTLPSVSYQQPQLSANAYSHSGNLAPSTFTSKLVEPQRPSYQRKLPKFTLKEFSGDPLEWPEWRGLFLSTVNSADISDDEKMLHLKTLVTGKAKSAIAHTSFSGAMYHTAWNTLERQFGQPHVVVCSYLEKLKSHPHVKMHNSQSIIDFSLTISSIVNIFQSLNYIEDLNASSILSEAVAKLPPNLRESWSKHVVRRQILKPSLLHFNSFLQTEAAAHNFMLSTTPKQPTNSKPKHVNTFASLSNQNSNKTPANNKTEFPPCVKCNGKHPLYKCEEFRKLTPTNRAKVAQQAQICFTCLNGKHIAKNCSRNKPCGKDGCTSKHNPLLHGADRVYTSNNRANPSAKKETTTASNTTSANTKGLLQVVEVDLKGPNGTIRTLAICDTASTHSWIDKDLAKELKLEGDSTTLSVFGLHAEKSIPSERVSVSVHSVHANPPCNISLFPYTKQNFVLGTERFDIKLLKSKWPHLKDIPDVTIDYAKVKLLIGNEAFVHMHPLEYQILDSFSPCAVRMPLGWVLSGPLPASSIHRSINNLNIIEDNLASQIKSWYDIETYASTHSVDPRTSDDKLALSQLEKGTYHDGERYIVPMLWKEDKHKLPNNYYSALAQLNSMEKRLNPDLRSKYKQGIDDDIQKGYLRKLPKEEVVATNDQPQWYLPHHPVLNPNKPGKVRRVLNGAAKFRGHSLNSTLLTGPDLLLSLIAIILRFREYAVAISADIEGMFMQVRVPESDQSCLRILWREESTSDVEVHQYERHIFGAKSSPTCANYALHRTAIDNASDFPEASKVVLTSFYMDDLLKSVATVTEAIELGKDLTKLLKIGGFNLTKWQSNSKQVTSALAIDSIATNDELHVLGLKWNCKEDSLVVSRGTSQTINNCKTVTQRLVLSTLSAVFDPIGLIAPFTIVARLLLRAIWRANGQDWDSPLNEELTQQFQAWASDLNFIQTTAINRRYFCSTPDYVELHVFGDASLDAFAAVAYLRGTFADGHQEVSFVIGKARVSPLKPLTIPKLELQAALLAARIKTNICKELTINIDEIYMWSDSVTTLQWIRSSHKRLPVFVANRVSEILEHTSVDQWNHVPGEQNPADHATRGLSANKLFESTWLKGPEFLFNAWHWPGHVEIQHTMDTSEEQDVTTAVSDSRPGLLDFNKYNSFRKYTRVLAFVLRLISPTKRESSNLSSNELKSAEMKLFMLSQQQSFSNEIQFISKHQNVPNNSRISSLSPFIDENGLLRSKGRISRLPTTYDIRHPIILDGKHPIVKQYIQMMHAKYHHEGTEYVRSIIQQHFWILRLRSILRSIKHHCVQCRRFSGSCLQPLMAELPIDRLAAREHPFTHTGVDYFGPLYVSVRRSKEKRWCFLFTCLTTRAIHLEVVHTMNSDSCVLAIQRFIARRGTPKVIRSDNGTNFVRSDKEIRHCINQWNQSYISDNLAHKGIEWKFNPPAAPHHGGAWERLVRSCKRALYNILGTRTLTDEVLSSALCLVEQSLNARPIVPASSDIADVEALTPNHFLLGRPHAFVPLTLSQEFDARKTYLRAEQYANQIWSRWLSEYVPTLNSRSKWRKPDRNIAVGDLVWIVDNTSPRGHYPLARVTTLEHGSDGVARAAVLRTATASLKRPTTKLSPVFGVLEVKNRAG